MGPATHSARTRSPPPSPPFTLAEFTELVSAALDPPRPPPSSWSAFPDVRLLKTRLEENTSEGCKHGHVPKTKVREGYTERSAFEMERVKLEIEGAVNGLEIVVPNVGEEEAKGDLTLSGRPLASSATTASSKKAKAAGIIVDPASMKSTGHRRPLDQKLFKFNHVPNSPTSVPYPYLCGHSHSPSRPRSRSPNSGIPNVFVTPPPPYSPPQEHKQGQSQGRRRSTITFAPLPLPSQSPKLLPLPLSAPLSRSNSNSYTQLHLSESTSGEAPLKPHLPVNENKDPDPMILFAPPPVLSNNNSTNNKNDNPSFTPAPNPTPTPIISATMSTVDLGMNCLTSLNVAVGGSPNVSVSAYGSSGVKEKSSRSKSKSKSRSASRSRSRITQEKEKEKEKKTPGLAPGSLLPSSSPSPLRGRSASASGRFLSSQYLSTPSSSRISAPPSSSSSSPSQLHSPPTPPSGSGSNPLALRVFAKIKKQLSRNSFNVNTVHMHAHDVSSASCPNTPISGAFNTNASMNVGMGAHPNKNEDADSPLPLEYRYEYEFDFPYEFGVVPGLTSSSSASGTGPTALSPPEAHIRERARSVISSSTSTSTSTSVSALVSPSGKGGAGRGKVSSSRYPTTNTDLGFTSFAALSAGNTVAGSPGSEIGKKVLAENEEVKEEDASMSTSRGGRRRGRTGRALPASEDNKEDDDEVMYHSSSSAASPVKPTVVGPLMGTASPASLTSSASSYSCESAPFSFSFFPPPAGVCSLPPPGPPDHVPVPPQAQEEEETFFSGHPYAHPELRSSYSSSPSLRSGASVFDVKFNHDADGLGSGSGSSGNSNDDGQDVSEEERDSDATSFIGSSCSFFVRMRARSSGPTVGVLEALGGTGDAGAGRARRAAPNANRNQNTKTDRHQHQQEEGEGIEPYTPYVPLIIQLERERVKEREKERKTQSKGSRPSSSNSASSLGSRTGTGSRSRSSTTPTPTPIASTMRIPSTTTTVKGGLSEHRSARANSTRTGPVRVSPPPPLLSASAPNRLSASSDASNASFESEGPITPRTPVFVVVSEDAEENGKSKNAVVQELSPNNDKNTIHASTHTATYSPSVNSATKNASRPTSRISMQRSRPKQNLVPNGTSPPLGPLPLIPNPNSTRNSLTKANLPRRPSRRGRDTSPGVPSSDSDMQQPNQEDEDNDEPDHRLSTSSTISSCVLGSIVSSSSSSSLSSSSSPAFRHERRPRFPSTPLSFSASASISDSDNSRVIYETPLQTPTLSVFPGTSADSAAAAAEAEAEAARILVANTRANAASLSFIQATGQIGVGRQIVRRGERTGGDWTLLLGAGEEKEKERVGGVKRCASNVGGKAHINGRTDSERLRTKSESALRTVARVGGRTSATSAVGGGGGGGGTEDWTLSMNLPMPGSIGRMGVVRKKKALDIETLLPAAEEIKLVVPRVVSVGSGIDDAVADEEDLARLEMLGLDDGDRPMRESRLGLRNTKSCGMLLSGTGGDFRSTVGRGTTVARMSSASQLIGTSAATSTTKSIIPSHRFDSVGRTNSMGRRDIGKVRRPVLPLTTLLPLPSPHLNSSLRPSSAISSNSGSSSTSDPELTPTPAVEPSTSNLFPFPDAVTRNRIQVRTQTPDVQESSDSMCSVEYYSARSSFALEA